MKYVKGLSLHLNRTHSTTSPSSPSSSPSMDTIVAMCKSCGIREDRVAVLNNLYVEGAALFDRCSGEPLKSGSQASVWIDTTDGSRVLKVFSGLRYNDNVSSRMKNPDTPKIKSLLHEIIGLTLMSESPRVVNTFGWSCRYHVNGAGAGARARYQFAISMERMDGDLFDLLEKDIDVDTKLSCIYESLRGVSELHSKGIVHRDIKPENILVSSFENRYRVVIGDLGCCAIDPADKGGTASGCVRNCFTPYYFPSWLKVITRDNETFNRCTSRYLDIYPLGVLFFLTLDADGGKKYNAFLEGVRQHSACTDVGSLREEIFSLVKTVANEWTAAHKDHKWLRELAAHLVFPFLYPCTAYTDVTDYRIGREDTPFSDIDIDKMSYRCLKSSLTERFGKNLLEGVVREYGPAFGALTPAKKRQTFAKSRGTKRTRSILRPHDDDPRDVEPTLILESTLVRETREPDKFTAVRAQI